MLNTHAETPQSSTPGIAYTSPVEQSRQATYSPTIQSAALVEGLLANHTPQPCIHTGSGNDLFAEVSASVCKSLISAAKTAFQSGSEALVFASPNSQLSTPSPLASIRSPQLSQHKTELFLPNELIGCIIGRGGNKINEIRQTSQANIKISSEEEGLSERRITITGTLPAVQMAQNMINSSIQLHKGLLALNWAMDLVYTEKANSPESETHRPTRHCCNSQTNRIGTGIRAKGADLVQNPTCSHACTMLTAQRDPIQPPSCLNSAPIGFLAEPTTSPGIPINSGLGFVESNRPLEQFTPLVAANSLERGGLAWTNRSLDETAHVLELISQLPKSEQQKWLTAFGLDCYGPLTL